MWVRNLAHGEISSWYLPANAVGQTGNAPALGEKTTMRETEKGLKNMDIIILGSGTCVPSIRRAGPAACVIAQGCTLLIDSASGTLRQLARAGIDYADIDMILYTHLHPDHMGEFVPFVFATRYAPDYTRKRPVLVLAGEGFSNFYSGLEAAFGEWIKPGDGRLDINEISVNMKTAMQFPPLTIMTSPVRHTTGSIAYRIEDSTGKAAVFSGDTDYCDELIDLASGADMLVLECAAPENAKVAGHLIPSEAGRIAARAGVKKLVLTHFYPECDRHDLVTPCRNEYDGPLILAEDMMRLVP